MPYNIRGSRRKGSYCDYYVYDPRASSSNSIVAEKIAKRITSKYNQHLTLIMVGNTGTGKSWAAINLAYLTALAVARIEKGKHVTPESWKDYFNLDHMAIITLERVTQLLQNIHKHGIYILDDIGVGYSNRDFMSIKNKKMNQIIQTFRTDNTCVIYTVPSKGFIDKVPRELVEWYFEFERSEQAFSEGINSCKFLDITTLKRENKQLFVYDLAHSATGAEQFVRHISFKPPEELTTPYEKLRTDIAQQLKIDNALEIMGGEKEGGSGISAEKHAERELEWRMVGYVDQFKVEGKTAKESCKMVGLPLQRYNVLKRGDTKWFEEFNVGVG